MMMMMMMMMIIVSVIMSIINFILTIIQGKLIPRLCDEIRRKIISWCMPNLPFLYYQKCVEKVRSEIDPLVNDRTVSLALAYLHDMGVVSLFIQEFNFKGCRMGRSDKVSLWYVALLINTRFRFFILE